MMTVKALDENCKVVDYTFVEIEKADVRPPYDTKVRSIEMESGWWELWNIDGTLCGYFIEEDEFEEI